MKAKRIVSILLTGSMLLSLLPVSALAAAPVFDAPAQTTAKKAAPLVQEADASRSTEEEAATRSSRDLDAENGTASSFTIDLKADGTPTESGDDDHWHYDPNSNGRLYLTEGVFTLQPSKEPNAESALQVVELNIEQKADFAGGTVGRLTYNCGTISNGTFQGYVYNGYSYDDEFIPGVILDGTFQGEVTNDGVISGGLFQGTVYNYEIISNGNFQGNVRNYRTISGGTFEKGMNLKNYDASITIKDGQFDGAVVTEECKSPLSITGGLFTKAVAVSSITPNNLSITGGYFVDKPTLPNGSDTSFATVSDQNGGNFQVPVNDGFSENSYTSLYVPSGSSEQPNTITVKTDTALIDCRAADADADVSIMSSVVSKGGNTYEIPVRGYEKVVLVTEVPAPPTPDEPGELDPGLSSGAAALGIVLGTAGLGYATYAYGTSLYLHYVLPDGFIPSTRQELATVLWTTAGKPDPVSTALYTDIPADAIEQQKAARWCAEQGLLSDHGATFGADTKVTNARIIRAWNSLKKVPVTIK